MTLLAVEARRADVAFCHAFEASQHRHGSAVPGGGAQPSRLDHQAFLLYEYFPDVPLAAARDIAHAARAGSEVQRLRRAAALAGDRSAVDPACEWLVRYAAQHLASHLTPEASLWRRLTAVHDRLRHADARALAEDASLAHLTTVAFAAVAGQPAPPELLASQTHLYLALSGFRDLATWRADLVAGRDTRVTAQLAGTVDETGSGTDELVRAARDRLYRGDIADAVLESVSDNLCRAAAAVTDLPAASWGAMIAGMLHEVDQVARDVARVGNRRGRPASSDETLAAGVDAIDRATTYIRGEQTAAGAWGDFLLLAQESTSWVTGYVGWNLAAAGADDDDLDAAARWLLAHELPGGGWSYNASWPVDIDSTANVLLLLASRDGIDPDEWVPALAELVTAQHPDGSFSTIVDPEAWMIRFRSDVSDVRGWSAPHPCVTATVALLLARIGGFRTELTDALNFLLRCQRPEGHWDAYWWAGPYYTTCRAVQALSEACRHGDIDVDVAYRSLDAAASWLTEVQSADGGWAVADAPAEAFHTALAMQAIHSLLDIRPDEGLARAVRRGREWLVDHQRADGSWSPSPILRVPRPDVIRPWEQQEWRQSIIGLDVVVPDWRRLFTTSTAVSALAAGREPAHTAQRGDDRRAAWNTSPMSPKEMS